jgi:retinol dehydrogenase 12
MVLAHQFNETFNVDADIPNLSGKIILVTGGTSGLGKGSVLELAKHKPERIYMTARSAKRGNPAVEDIKAVVPDANITFLELDLTSMASVQKAAKQILGEVNRLDILIANAGIMNVSETRQHPSQPRSKLVHLLAIRFPPD